MSKMMIMEIPLEIQQAMQNEADAVFQQAVELVEKYGVCYMRFTKEDGIVLIKPEYNQRLNGVISNA